MPYSEPTKQLFLRHGKVIKENVDIPSDEELFPRQLKLTMQELNEAKKRITTLEIENRMMQSRLDELEERVRYLEANQWPSSVTPARSFS